MNLLRAVFSEKGMGGNYAQIRDRMTSDREFKTFYSGESPKPPTFYHNRIRTGLAPFYETLPSKVLNYLNHGEPYPNDRVSNSLTH